MKRTLEQVIGSCAASFIRGSVQDEYLVISQQVSLQLGEESSHDNTDLIPHLDEVIDLKLFQRNFCATLKNTPFFSTPETVAELALHLERLSLCNRPNSFELIEDSIFSLIGL